MKLIKQSYKILEQKIPVRKLDDYSGSHFREEYIKELYKHIELCGRTCYRSEDKITEDSASRFVNGLIKSKHYSVLEHGVVYLHYPYPNKNVIKYERNPYSKTILDLNLRGGCYVTTNYRVIIENGWEEDLQYLCEPTEYHEKRHTVLLHSCIHTYKDLTRHRKMSFSIESTRYVNYSKTDKFGEMKFILPTWLEYLNKEGTYYGEMRDASDRYKIGDSLIECKELLNNSETYLKIRSEIAFLNHLFEIEQLYRSLVCKSWQPQQAAEILPQCTAADVVMSGYSSDWEFIFRLRTSYIHETGQPHPLVAEIMDPLYDEFVNRNYINKLV